MKRRARRVPSPAVDLARAWDRLRRRCEGVDRPKARWAAPWPARFAKAPANRPPTNDVT